jgi:hypothetical protein
MRGSQVNWEGRPKKVLYPGKECDKSFLRRGVPGTMAATSRDYSGNHMADGDMSIA